MSEHEVLPEGSWRLFREDKDSGYDPRTRPYYLKAKAAGKLVWLPPYVFFNQGVPGVSCATPIYNGNQQLRGVISIDFDLQSLSEFVASLSLSEHSEIFLFTADGILLAHPNPRTSELARKGNNGELITLADAQGSTCRCDAYALRESRE